MSRLCLCHDSLYLRRTVICVALLVVSPTMLVARQVYRPACHGLIDGRDSLPASTTASCPCCTCLPCRSKVQTVMQLYLNVCRKKHSSINIRSSPTLRQYITTHIKVPGVQVRRRGGLYEAGQLCGVSFLQTSCVVSDCQFHLRFVWTGRHGGCYSGHIK